MEEPQDTQYCYQDRNSSCKKELLSTSTYITLYIFFSLISVVTVFMNLVVIISISHYKQLHTPTNLLILSLAVSDLLVGLIVIPAMTVAILESCWVLGNYFCALLISISYVFGSTSIGNLVLISIDRYVAVCDPLLYVTKITTRRTLYCISITWCCGIIYNAVLIKISVNVQVPCMCFVECYFFEGFLWSSFIDLFIAMIIPCSIIITLYLKIFVVARSQARRVFLEGAATVSSVKSVQANSSERKAAKTLAIVVFNYLIWWVPIFFNQYMYLASGDTLLVFLYFLPLVNSFINPIIYAFFYPWFKVTVKRVLTLKLS